MRLPNQKHKRSLKHKRFLLLALVLLPVLVLRETGLLTLSLFTSQSQSSTVATSTKSSHRVTGSERKSEVLERVPGDLPVTYSVRVQGDPVAAKAVQAILGRHSLGPSKPIAVQVTAMQIQGLYWLPLYKRGTCRFVARMSGNNTGTNAGDAQYRGSLSGTTSMTVVGLCSSYQFRTMLGKEVAQKISKQVSQELD